MFKTIVISGRILAQGLHVGDLPDGRIRISTGAQVLAGWPVAGGVAGTRRAAA